MFAMSQQARKSLSPLAEQKPGPPLQFELPLQTEEIKARPKTAVSEHTKYF